MCGPCSVIMPGSALARERRQGSATARVIYAPTEPCAISGGCLVRLIGDGYCQPAHSTHGRPVVFISCPAKHAHLIVAPMNAVRPGEPVRAKLLEEEGKKFRHCLG